ncbi:PhnA-like protein [Methylobacterium tarhaniae]|uniref:PhnA-like protein n=1 Tax=Methylobacterium tarhaniae TaxID=1187852 RepID=UPI003D04884E
MALRPAAVPPRDAVSVGAAPLTDDLRTVMLHRLSWGAVLAGAASALVVQLILNLIGLGAGLAAVSATTGDNPEAGTLSQGALLWGVFSGIFASAAGGYLAGRLSGKPAATAGHHGLISFVATTLVVVYLLTSAASGLVGGAFGGLTSALGGAGQAIGGTVKSAAETVAPALNRVADPFAGIERQVRDTSGGQDPQALRDTAVHAVRAALTGDAAQQQQARDRAAEALAKAKNIPADQARQQVQDYETQYRDAAGKAAAQARQAAEATRKAASQGALYAAGALILGALAAYLAGRSGAVS